jgi:hypothetical protein|tara:strand:+ start:98 stop:361 length:264 start_codon:yes stop_codon:yes gene_type:complete
MDKNLPDPLEALLSEVSGGGSESDGSEGLTSEQMMDATGLSSGSLLRKLRRLKREGRLDVSKVMRESLDGKARPHTVYAMKKADDAA